LKNLLTIILVFFTTCFFGQTKQNPNDIDSASIIPFFGVSYAIQFTGNDMAKRFNTNYNVGGNFTYKTKKNWIYGFKGNFIWGGNVKQTNILDNIAQRNGFINSNGKYEEEILMTDDNGTETKVFLGERGSSFFAFGGKVFSVLAPNSNSGFMIYGGAGLLQHKISIKFQDKIVALSDNYKKGYDRFSMGFALNGFVGYLLMSDNRIFNFYGGFDITQGWTKNMRKFNFDTQKYDNKIYSDLLYGFRVGWIIRLNKRDKEQFYYY